MFIPAARFLKREEIFVVVPRFFAKVCVAKIVLYYNVCNIKRVLFLSRQNTLILIFLPLFQFLLFLTRFVMSCKLVHNALNL